MRAFTATLGTGPAFERLLVQVHGLLTLTLTLTRTRTLTLALTRTLILALTRTLTLTLALALALALAPTLTLPRCRGGLTTCTRRPTPCRRRKRRLWCEHCRRSRRA